MSIRTTTYVVHFSSPFLLEGCETLQPAGKYQVEADEELIEGISWLAYRRVATFIHLPAINSRSLISRVVKIDPADLEAALQKDNGRS
ncbi:hypothetical protein [Mesorhizobium sp. J18]|uniref:hypothetical protein n=1 Tax=Mesorhizobium sp. J18 TaxID=935263 RepID=UPI0011A5D6F7|nr:hypothetical protein [Mesorhizobium sp. J18]